MCSNASADVNNCLHETPHKESKGTLTLEFGAYMNWGRWNHNTRRIQPIIDALLDKGFNVQLKHVDTESQSLHGFFAIYSAEGTELIRDKDIQHNRRWQGMREAMQDLASKASENVAKAA